MSAKRFSWISVGIVGLLVSGLVEAWDGSVVGTVGQIDVTGGGNYDLRIYFASPVAMCGNGNTFAYINQADPNYSTYATVLTASKSLGSTVIIYSNRDANGYCHIGYITQK